LQEATPTPMPMPMITMPMPTPTPMPTPMPTSVEKPTERYISAKKIQEVFQMDKRTYQNILVRINKL